MLICFETLPLELYIEIFPHFHVIFKLWITYKEKYIIHLLKQITKNYSEVKSVGEVRTLMKSINDYRITSNNME